MEEHYQLIKYMGERFVDLYNQKILYSKETSMEENKDILVYYSLYFVYGVNRISPDLQIYLLDDQYLMESNGVFFDIFGNYIPVSQKDHLMKISDMELELYQGDTLGLCDPLRNRVWKNIEPDLLMDSEVYLEMLRHQKQVLKKSK